MSAPTTGRINESLSTPVVAAVLTGGSGTTGTGVSGVSVSFTGTDGLFPRSATSTTTTSGYATTTVILGRQPLSQTITATATVSGAMLTASTTIAATSPADRSLVPILNQARLSGTTTGLAGHAADSYLGSIRSMTVAGDGTVYVAPDSGANCRIFRIDTNGHVALIAGTGVCTNTGDSGPATAATIQSPHHLQVAHDNSSLVFATIANGDDFIRRINLSTGIIETIGGGGSVGAPTYGDNGPATSAQIHVNGMVLNSDATEVAILDQLAGRTRRLNLQTGLIAAEPRLGGTANTVCAGSQLTSLDLITYDPDGALIANVNCGNINGTLLSISPPQGATRALTLEPQPGAFDPGQSALNRYFPAYGTGTRPIRSTWAPATNLLINTRDRILLIDGTTSLVSNACGSGNVGPVLNDYSDCRLSPLDVDSTYTDKGVASDDDGNLYLLDAQPGIVVMAYRALPTTAPTIGMTVTAGNNQSLLSGQQSAPLEVTVRDGANAPLQNVRVRFETSSPGTGFYEAAGYSAANGTASAIARASLQAGPITISASTRTLRGTPISTASLQATSEPPANGVLFPVVNADFTEPSSAPATMPAPFEPIGNGIYGTAASGDGSVYYAGYSGSFGNNIHRVGPDGSDTVLLANANAYWLALNATEMLLYFYRNDASKRIDVIDLATGAVSQVAGGGMGPETAGAAALGANLQVGQLWVDAVGRIFYSYANPFRYVDPSTGLLGELSVTNPSLGCAAWPPQEFVDFRYSAKGPGGSTFFTATHWTSCTLGGQVFGKRDAAGTLTVVSPMPGGMPRGPIVGDGQGGFFFAPSLGSPGGTVSRYTPGSGLQPFAFGGAASFADFAPATSISTAGLLVRDASMSASPNRLVIGIQQNTQPYSSSIRAIEF